MSTKSPKRYDAKVIVCATAQPECRRLIQVGKAMAEAQGVSLEILNVQPLMRDNLQWVEHLDKLYEIARDEGAQLSVYYNDFPVAVAATHISRCHATDIITRFPRPGNHQLFYLHAAYLVARCENPHGGQKGPRPCHGSGVPRYRVISPAHDDRPSSRPVFRTIDTGRRSFTHLLPPARLPRRMQPQAVRPPKLPSPFSFFPSFFVAKTPRGKASGAFSFVRQISIGR